MAQHKDFDFIVIGSGFGGSISALRLAEKGYRVAVIEKGRQFRPEDLPSSNWNLRGWLWMPWLRWFGPFSMRPMRHVFALCGVGVGGGSLVYGNVMMRLQGPTLSRLGLPETVDWEAELAPAYEKVERRLGVRTVPQSKRLEEELIYVKDPDLLAAPVPVAVNFEGPEACTNCGACSTGCRVGAKMTMDRTYLKDALEKGVTLLAETRVENIQESSGPEGGYRIETVSSTSWLDRSRRTFTTRGVVVAAGTLGTNELLLRCRSNEARGLSRAPSRIGEGVSFNQEEIQLIQTDRPDDYSTGLMVHSEVADSRGGKVLMVGFGKSSSLFRLTGAVPGAGHPLASLLAHPIRALRHILAKDWTDRTIACVYMKADAPRYRMSVEPIGPLPGRGMLNTRELESAPPPNPEGALPLVSKIAKVLGGSPLRLVIEPPRTRTVTAHAFGGCAMGEVVDERHRLRGYEHFYICDGSVLPRSPGEAPSLTIAAMTERCMGYIPPKS